MYKSRFTKWKLDKNNRYPDMLFLLHKQKQRLAVNKDSRFTVSDRVLDRAEVDRFFTRKIGRVPTTPEMAAQYVPAGTPPHISYDTPSPQPCSDDRDTSETLSPQTYQASPEPLSSQVRNVRSPPVVLVTSPCTKQSCAEESCDTYMVSCISTEALRYSFAHSYGMAEPISTPQIYYIPEELMKNMAVYVEGYKICGLWRVDESGFNLNIMHDTYQNRHSFTSLCNTAILLLKGKSFVEAGKLLSQASGLLYNFLNAPSAQALPTFFWCFMEFYRTGNSEIATIFLNHIAQMASTIYSRSRSNVDNHWTRICQLLANIESRRLQETVLQLWNHYNKILGDNIGHQHKDTLRSSTTYLQAMARLRGLDPVEPLLNSLLETCEHACGSNDHQTVYVMQVLNDSLYDHGRYSESCRIAREICEKAALSGNLHSMSCGMQRIAWNQYHMGEYALAEESMKGAIDCLSSFRGNFESNTQMAQLQCELEQWYRQWGLEQDAGTLREEISGTISEVND